MKILLTGGTGFLGSHLLRQLIASGHDVASLQRSRTPNSRTADLVGRYQIIPGTLEQIEDAKEELQQFKPQALAHLAWDGVGNADRNNLRQLDNIQTTIRLVQIAAECGVTQLLATGSQAEYGPCNEPIDESNATNPTTMYGTAKLATCHATRQLCSSLGMRWTWLRVFSTYGPTDAPYWMIPQLIQGLLARKPVPLTKGEQLWDYLYVDDAAEAMAKVLESSAGQGVFNLGSGKVQTIRRIAETLRDAVDPALRLGFGEVPYRPDQVMRLQPRVERLRDAIGWSPRVTLEEGLQRTVNFFRSTSTQGSVRAA